jgi:hypothetical protein
MHYVIIVQYIRILGICYSVDDTIVRLFILFYIVRWWRTMPMYCYDVTIPLLLLDDDDVVKYSIFWSLHRWWKLLICYIQYIDALPDEAFIHCDCCLFIDLNSFTLLLLLTHSFPVVLFHWAFWCCWWWWLQWYDERWYFIPSQIYILHHLIPLVRDIVFCICCCCDTVFLLFIWYIWKYFCSLMSDLQYILLVVILLSLFHWVPALTWCLWNAFIVLVPALFDRCWYIVFLFPFYILMIRCCCCCWYILWYCCYSTLMMYIHSLPFPLGATFIDDRRVTLIRRRWCSSCVTFALRLILCFVYMWLCLSPVCVSFLITSICVYYSRGCWHCLLCVLLYSTFSLHWWKCSAWVAELGDYDLIHSIPAFVTCLFIAIHFLLLFCYVTCDVFWSWFHLSFYCCVVLLFILLFVYLLLLFTCYDHSMRCFYFVFIGNILLTVYIQSDLSIRYLFVFWYCSIRCIVVICCYSILIHFIHCCYLNYLFRLCDVFWFAVLYDTLCPCDMMREITLLIFDDVIERIVLILLFWSHSLIYIDD